MHFPKPSKPYYAPFLGLALAAVLVLPQVARADARDLKDAQTALAAIVKKHRAAKAVSVSFESRAEGADGNPLPVSKGSLLAADSGRFRLQHAQGTVVSDGKTVWQYFPSTKQLVIKDAADAGEAGGVLLRFLQARALKADKRAGQLRVVLDPASVGESLDSLILTLAADNASVKKVETLDPAGNRVEYQLKSMRYDVRPDRSTFVLKKPAGVEVLDMR